MESISARSKRALGAGAIIAAGVTMIVGGASAAVAAPLPQGIDAPLGMCTPDGGFPWINGSTPEQPQVHDTGVNTYVGGDLTVTGSAEAEGLLVVAGDMHIDRSFIVGIAIGSDIRPAPGETQLQVGGDVTAADGAVLHVGDLAQEGGEVRIGGSAADGIIKNGSAALRTGLTAPVAVDPYGDFGTRIQGWSSTLGTQPANGTVSVNGGGWVEMELRGNGVDELQVFDVTAAQLASANAIYFRGIHPYAPIVVNVTGQAVSMKANTYDYNDMRAPFGIAMTSQGDGDIAASVLWNLQDATTATIGGSTQIPGSFLAPRADVEAIANTNGRMYVGGNLLASGAGNELHSYPWSGTCRVVVDPDPGTDTDTDADANGGGTDAGANGGGTDAGANGGGTDAGTDGDADVNGITGTDPGAGSGTGASADAGANGSGSGAGGPLATTGGQAPLWLLGGGAAVVLAGIALVIVARARRAAE
ncbi:MAG: choice-of-anchor A family protein [Microbacterium sp.]|nr:choice-of-anchor A family protein [Microbacterium sp.]